MRCHRGGIVTSVADKIGDVLVVSMAAPAKRAVDCEVLLLILS